MLQRLQSVFLAIIVVNSIIMIFLPFATLIDSAGSTVLTTAGFSPERASDSLWIMIALSALILAIAAINSYAISLFKDRRKQVKVTRLGVFISVLVFGLSFFAIDTVLGSVQSKSIEFEYGFAVYFPIVNILLGFLAIRFIKKDEALVRAADRLR